MTRSTTARSLKATLAIGALTMLALTTRGDAAATPIIVVNPTPTDCYGRAGCLDTSFGNAGKVLQDVGGSQSYTFRLQMANVIAVQPDGKLVAAGTTRYGGTFATWVVARFDASGALDPSFGIGGIVTFANFTAKNDAEEVNAIELQPDGKILLAGQTGYDSSTGAFVGVARLDSSGNLDGSFGVGGKVAVSFGGRLIYAMKRQSDGKILLAGGDGPLLDPLIARLNANGSTDTTFGSNGFRTIYFPVGSGLRSRVRALAILSNGKIVAAGHGGGDCALARLMPSGALDLSFGLLGTKVVSLVSNEDGIYNIAIASDDSIVAVGRAWATSASTSSNMLVVRFSANGSLVNSFGNSGKVLLDMHGDYDLAASLAIQTNGRIVFGGRALSGSNYFAIVGRLTAGGALDSTFGTGGITETSYTAAADSTAYTNALVLDSTGRIVVAGMANGGQTGLMTFGLARFQGQ